MNTNTGETKMYTDQQKHQIYVEVRMKTKRAFEKTFAKKFRDHMFDKCFSERSRFATQYNLRKNKNGSWNDNAMNGLLHGKKYPKQMQNYLARLWNIAQRVESYEGYVSSIKFYHMDYAKIFEIRGEHPWYMEEILNDYKGQIGK
jgi:hypothetical protein